MDHTQFAKVVTSKQPMQYHDDPLGLYTKLTQNGPNTMLLESAEIDSKDHLKSMLLTHAAMKILCDSHTLIFTALTDNGAAMFQGIRAYFKDQDCQQLGDTLTVRIEKNTEILDEDTKLKAVSPLDGLRALIKGIRTGNTPQFEDLFLGGAMAYDLIDSVEPLPKVPMSTNTLPDYIFYVAETLVMIDHQTQKADIITHQFDTEPHTTERLRVRTKQLQENGLTLPATPELKPITEETAVNISDADFMKQVSDSKEYIVAGDVFQIVISRSFSLPCPNTLGAYRALRLTNPSPYMFYLNGPDFTLFGASPESAIKYEVDTNQVEIYPIAGTRRRGKTADGQIDFDLDSRIELELRLDEKELAEHLMLVDLARNDVARISQTGTRKVDKLLKVDRYSHVMHLVSLVTGQLREDLDALHAYQACMNMGTLMGAPKVRAAQLIRDVEQRRRGSYGGAVGYLNALGDMDTCIIIRSAFVKNGVAHIQAGAGVVHDSDPQAEADESRSKAQAVISAIKMGAGQ
ncbi:anthranilate synthase component 1 [Shewanella gelidii]|uniref:Anthranilate synthase component 1 n=1 Tax=Shewanella gelidii TaxID=1642821 RepID=A0A917JS90_9GAMM|nr:anthranilate synthase component 1 [Shewanella gelidii]MCL1098270.1 anthranilate synthase component 1 [Shewanella gelidii]GGI83915.1 anthranilate synthase component 1 [Shewanella gelidii]